MVSSAEKEMLTDKNSNSLEQNGVYDKCPEKNQANQMENKLGILDIVSQADISIIKEIKDCDLGVMSAKAALDLIHRWQTIICSRI